MLDPATVKRTPKCKPCGDTGFVFPLPGLRHYCGCLKGIQRLRESRDELLAFLKDNIDRWHRSGVTAKDLQSARAVITKAGGAA